MESCDAAVPFTLLWSLIRAGGSSSAASSSCSDAVVSRFLRDYIARFTNASLWVALISVTVLLARKLARLVRLWNLGSRIPGPPVPSFFDYLKFFSSLGSGGNLTGYLAKLHAEYGPIVRLWLGPTQLLVSVRETSMIEEVLVKAEDKLPLTRRAFRLAFGRSGLFASSFEKVHERRESLAACLSGKLLERANTVAPKVVKRVMVRLDSIMAKGVLDCRSISQHMAFALFGTTLFGDAFLAWSDAIIYEEMLMLIAKDACFWASYNVPPVWKRQYRAYQTLCKEAKRLTQDILQYCKSYAKSNERADATSLLDDGISNRFLLDEIEGHLVSEDEQCGDIVGMMFHGCLATSSLIWSILTRLALYPEVQEKIYSEIVRVQRGSSNPQIYDVRNMHFLRATVYESARLLPGESLLQRCSVNCDLSLETGITVPAGAIIVVPMQLVHLDNSIWGKDASQFNPNRFLSKALCYRYSSAGEKPDSVSVTSVKDQPVGTDAFVVSRAGTSDDSRESEETTFRFNEPKQNKFLSFGSGTRACVGQELTLLGISTFLAALLQEYEVRIQACPENSSRPAADDVTLRHLPSAKIAFVKRNKS